MKTLTVPELAVLRGFVRDVFSTIENDDTGVSWDLEDQALAAADILEMHEPEYDDEQSESD